MASEAAARTREIERRRGRRADLGQRVEHQDDVGVALPLMLRDVERAQAQRGAPVHLPDPVAGRERPNVTGLDALAERGRHVVADGGLGAAGAAGRLRRGAMRGYTRTCLRSTWRVLPGADAPAVADPRRRRVPELVHAAARPAHLVAQARRLARAEGHHRRLRPASSALPAGQRLEHLDERDGARAVTSTVTVTRSPSNTAVGGDVVAQGVVRGRRAARRASPARERAAARPRTARGARTGRRARAPTRSR